MYEKRVVSLLLVMAFITLVSSTYIIDTVSKELEVEFELNYVESTLEGIHALSVEFDHQSGIRHSGNTRQVWGRTQAWDGNGQFKLDSYTRARFECTVFKTVKADSGRVYSVNGGSSYAESGWFFSD